MVTKLDIMRQRDGTDNWDISKGGKLINNKVNTEITLEEVEEDLTEELETFEEYKDVLKYDGEELMDMDKETHILILRELGIEKIPRLKKSRVELILSLQD